MTARKRLPHLRRRLRIKVAEILDLPSRRMLRPMMVRAQDRNHEVTVIVGPRGKGPRPPLPAENAWAGRWFSGEEQAIWDALAGGPLRGRAVAAAVHVEYSARLRLLLSNLVERGCLSTGPQGYLRSLSEGNGS